MEIVTFILGLIGSIGTFVISVRSYLASRKHIEIRIEDYADRENGILQFFIEIQNQSSNPICISKVFIKFNDQRYPCELIRKRILETRAGYQYSTPDFPLNLSPQMGQLYFLEFLHCPDIGLVPGNKIAFVFQTNHGEINKDVNLPDMGHYLHKK